jgi:hypothetical protein
MYTGCLKDGLQARFQLTSAILQPTFAATKRIALAYANSGECKNPPALAQHRVGVRWMTGLIGTRKGLMLGRRHRSPEPNAMSTEAVATAVRRSRCILFLGAGVNHPPSDGSKYSYQPDESPSLGGELAEQLAKKSDLFAKHTREEKNGSICRGCPGSSKTMLATGIDYRHWRCRGWKNHRSPVVRALAELTFTLIIAANDRHVSERALVKAELLARDKAAARFQRREIENFKQTLSITVPDLKKTSSQFSPLT